jgi:hypothetical protein
MKYTRFFPALLLLRVQGRDRSPPGRKRDDGAAVHPGEQSGSGTRGFDPFAAYAPSCISRIIRRICPNCTSGVVKMQRCSSPYGAMMTFPPR